ERRVGVRQPRGAGGARHWVRGHGGLRAVGRPCPGVGTAASAGCGPGVTGQQSNGPAGTAATTVGPAPQGSPATSGAGDAGEAPWLAVIDMQRVFAEPDSQWLAPRFAEIVGPVRELVDAFRPRVTFTRFEAPEAPAGAWRQYYQVWPFALQPRGARIYEL